MARSRPCHGGRSAHHSKETLLPGLAATRKEDIGGIGVTPCMITASMRMRCSRLARESCRVLVLFVDGEKAVGHDVQRDLKTRLSCEYSQ